MKGRDILTDINKELVHDLLKDYPVPPLIKIRQNFPRPVITDIEGAVRRQILKERIVSTIKPGMHIAITAGSRGVANIHIVIREICRICKERQALPFIVPAMGSHGGATAEGQRALIEGYGITEEFCSAPIRSSMETKYIGDTEEGNPVYIDKNAAEADGIIVVGRVKPHTDFRGPYESGIMKMMTIGLGKQYGAEQFHKKGAKYMAHNIPLYGNAIRTHTNVLFALALVENAYDETCIIQSMANEEIPQAEPPLLEKAKSLMGRILFDSTDVLIIDRIGKDISGTGMDPNVTGTFITPYASGGIQAMKRVVLDLTDKTHGALLGLGMADATTQRCFDRCNLYATYVNALTNTIFDGARIPLIFQSDKDAIQACLKYCGDNDKDNPRVVRIQDTLHLEEIWISEALLDEARENPMIEVLEEVKELPFDKDGNLW
jgi:hypothetical protein